MATAPLPRSLPGRFFVLEWDKDREYFTLYVDDGQGSSYKLGDLRKSQFEFKMWGIEEFGARVVDQAREFGRVQAIPSQNRIINLIDRGRKRPMVWPKTEGSYAHLPDL
jgi:hypothetical protein